MEEKKMQEWGVAQEQNKKKKREDKMDNEAQGTKQQQKK